MGGKGKNAENVIKNNEGIASLEYGAQAANDPRILEALQNYQSGGASLQDSISALSGMKADPNANSKLQKEIAALEAKKNAKPVFSQGMGPLPIALNPFSRDDEAKLAALKGDLKAAKAGQASMPRHAINEIFSNPLTGTQVATEQVQSNPLLAGMFGKGGMQDRMLTEEQDLAQRGWTLKPEDYEAYGQASDDISRMFGQEEASLASMLASRGLAAGASGAAGAAYSGLQGNKNERLAGQQRQIAQQRMEMNRQRLNDVRNMSLESNQLAQSAIQGQYGRNRESVQDYRSVLKDAASAGQMRQGQENLAFDQRVATQGPGIGGVIGGIAGAGLGALTGGIGTSLGSSIGSSLGGAITGASGSGGGLSVPSTSGLQKPALIR